MPPPPPLPAGKSETEQLLLKGDQVTDESLAATQRMKALCEEAKDAGTRALVAVDDQGEKLDNIERGMHSIQSDMKEASENMKGIGSKMISFISKPFKSKGGSKDSKSGGDGGDGGTSLGGAKPLSDEGVPTYGGFVAKITNDAREVEMEDNLGDISNMVSSLKHMANDLGSEITNQNKQIDRINTLGEGNVSSISVANTKAREMLTK